MRRLLHAKFTALPLLLLLGLSVLAPAARGDEPIPSEPLETPASASAALKLSAQGLLVGRATRLPRFPGVSQRPRHAAEPAVRPIEGTAPDGQGQSAASTWKKKSIPWPSS